MRIYSVCIKWNHLGSRYPINTHGRFKATSMSAAVGAALREVKKTNGKAWREPKAATVRIDIIVVGNEEREVDNGRRDVLRQEAEPESGR